MLLAVGHYVQRRQGACAAAMTVNSVRLKALERAVKLVGGVDEMAAMLGVSASCVMRWLQGDPPIPVAVFFRSVDVIVDIQSGSVRGETSQH